MRVDQDFFLFVGFLSFLRADSAFFAVPFFFLPKIASHPSENFLVSARPTRTMLTGFSPLSPLLSAGRRRHPDAAAAAFLP